MNSEVVQGLLYAVVLPTLVAAIALLAAWRPWKRAEEGEAERSALASGQWGGALAAGLAFLASVAGVVGGFPRPDSPLLDQRLGWVAIAALALGLLESFWRDPAWARWLVRAVVLAVASWWLFKTLPGAAWAWSLAMLAWTLAAIPSLELPAEKAPGAAVPFALGVMAALSGALIVGVLNSGKFAILAGSLGSAFGAATLLSWWRPERAAARGLAIVAGTLLPALLLSAYFLAPDRPSIWTLVPLALAPLGCWVRVAGPLARKKPWMATAAAIVVAGTLAASSLAIGFATAPEPPPDVEEYDPNNF